MDLNIDNSQCYFVQFVQIQLYLGAKCWKLNKTINIGSLNEWNNTGFFFPFVRQSQQACFCSNRGITKCNKFGEHKKKSCLDCEIAANKSGKLLNNVKVAYRRHEMIIIRKD